MPPGIDDIELSNDAKYLYEIAVAVSSGVCSAQLASMWPGPIHHARWLTKASRTLRSYIASENPSNNLRVLVEFIMRLYVPTYFSIKYRSSCTQGSIHFFNLIKALNK